MSVSTKNKKPSKTTKVKKSTKATTITNKQDPNYKRDHIVPKPIDPKVDKICCELQGIQRKRTIVIKSRIMMVNRLRSVVAGTLGYKTKLDEKERQAKFKEAMVVIKSVLKGDTEHEYQDIIKATMAGAEALDVELDKYEKAMTKLAKQLPVAEWIDDPERRGVGLLTLATIVGEAGNLSNYPAPPKLWRFMGVAPWTFNGETKMGATWKSGREGKLPAEEWTKFKYNPRRRSIVYLIGENIIKQNSLAYRKFYDEKKQAAKLSHPEWGGENGEKAKRYHLHAMLVTSKRVLKDLWREWNR